MTSFRVFGGFDYQRGVEVRLMRAQWRELIGLAASTVRARGDLLLKDRQGRLTHEIWDW